MLVQFSMWPLDRPHMSEDLAQVTEILERTGVRYEVGPMGTTIEGEWDEVMNAIQTCHESFRAEHQRVLTSITIDDDATRTLSINESTAKVAAHRDAAG